MSKEKKPVKTYTAKQVIKAALPWVLIALMVIPTAGAFVGWTLRGDFQGAIQREVSEQVSQLKEGQ
jgi:hypothetical protein